VCSWQPSWRVAVGGGRSCRLPGGHPAGLEQATHRRAFYSTGHLRAHAVHRTPTTKPQEVGDMRHGLNDVQLRVALARRGWPQWRLASRLGVSPSTFSGYRRGRTRPPARLLDRAEHLLGLAPGALRAGTDTTRDPSSSPSTPSG